VGVCAGVLLFQVAGQQEAATDDMRVMEIFISGDACISIYTHLCPSDNSRPMALDILWQVRAAHPSQRATAVDQALDHWSVCSAGRQTAVEQHCQADSL